MRVKYLDWNLEDLYPMFLDGSVVQDDFIVQGGLPQDSRFIAVEILPDGDRIRFTVESQSFPDVEPYGPAVTFVNPIAWVHREEESKGDGLSMGPGDDESGADGDPPGPGSFPF